MPEALDASMLARFASRATMLAAVCLAIYGLGWNYSTERYLKGFADAIVPLSGSPQEKTEALVDWFHHEPKRIDTSVPVSAGLLDGRDPVYIVQNARLLGVCGTSSNAFMNLAAAAGLKVRRLLLLDQYGGTMHVVAEVQWGDRWVVVNPQQGLVFKDKQGHGLTKQELRDPAVFADAISRMPGYDPDYNFQHTIHLHLERVPVLGHALRIVLNHLIPGWDEAVNWAYFPENPSLWLIFVSIPLLLLGILGDLMVRRYRRNRQGARAMASVQ
jgi:hypothetical protein